MDSLVSQIGLGIVVFASTNIDDILLLTAFFADRHLKSKNIIAGQFLGIAALVLTSFLVAWASVLIPQRWIALLGLLPLFLGVRALIGLWNTDEDEVASPGEQEKRAESRFHLQLFAVAAVTIANGGDNLGVYIPLFANHGPAIPLYVLIFALMTAVWCALGYFLVNNRWLGETIRKYGSVALPFVLIALGVQILSGLF